MSTVTVYATIMCPYCYRAKALLKKKGVSFDVIDVGMDVDKREEMMARSGGRRQVPQIFIGETHIGGCDELYALDRADKLDGLLAT